MFFSVDLHLKRSKKMKASRLGHLITDYLNDKGLTVSPKKLQKLIYYVDAWHLVHFDKAIVDENFEAWVHGPVVPELYQELKTFGFNNIKVVNDELEDISDRINKYIVENNISEDQKNLIFSVLNQYGVLSPLELEMLTHSEAPWIEARGNTPPHQRCNTIISKERMKGFYRAKIA